VKSGRRTDIDTGVLFWAVAATVLSGEINEMSTYLRTAVRRLLSAGGSAETAVPRRGWVAAVGCVGLLSSGAALAQASSGAAEARVSGSLEEVVVTAQKRVERLQDVPVPVTALSAESLAENNQLRLQDFFASVPALSYNANGDGRQSIAIRGVTTGGLNATVGVTIDDAPFGASSFLGYSAVTVPDIDPADLARVEVLRGPQGTLYGASSIGGLLKFVTVDPSTSRLSGRVQVDGSSITDGGTGYGVRGSINVPLSDTFAIRASAFSRRDAGYIDSAANGKDVNQYDVKGGRIATLWKPTENISLKLNLYVQKSNGDGTGEVLADGRFKPTAGLTQDRTAGTGTSEAEVHYYSAIVGVDFGSAAFTSITSWSRNKFFSTTDFSNSVYGTLFNTFVYPNATGANIINDLNTRKFTQELRVASNGDDRVEWLVGGFYTSEVSGSRTQLDALIRQTGQNLGLLANLHNGSNFEEYALFGDVTVKLTPRIDVQFGGRASENRQFTAPFDEGPLLEPLGLGTDFVYYVQTNTTDRANTYLITPRFKITPDLMAYVRLASGYRVGGPNAGLFPGDPNTSFGPDSTRNYDIGMKGSFFDRRLSFDAALFYIDWKDIQISITDPVTTAVFFRNASKARSQGAELSVEARPWPSLTLSASGSYIDATLSADLPAGAAIGKKGDRLPFSGKVQWSASAQQEFPLPGSLTGFVGASAAHVADRYSGFPASTRTSRYIFPAYTQADIRAGVRGESWTANLFVTNVGNERGTLSGSPKSGGRTRPTDPFYAVFTRPRTIGLSLSKNF
jgi:iron complex outermembrane receptor protein